MKVPLPDRCRRRRRGFLPGGRVARWVALYGVALLGALSGCGRPKGVALGPPVFYPPPPAKPRLQFLRSLSSSADVRPAPGAFVRLVLGEADGSAGRRLVRPYGVALWEGKLYVCDSGARRCVIFDLVQQQFRVFGHEGSFRLGLPVNISVGPGGEKFVTDTTRGQVVVYDRDDRPLRAITRQGGMRPCDALLYGGELFVADLKANTILVLEPASGRVVREFGGSGSQPGQFSQPTNLAVGPEGHLYVCDTLNARVQKLDRSGKVVQVIGSRGRRLGQMVRPKGIAVDREGRLYVADAATDSVQLYDRAGRLLMVLGGPGGGRGGLSLPAKVAISYEGTGHFAPYAAPGFTIEYLVFVSSQLGPNKINVYGFGRHEGSASGGIERIVAPGPAGDGPKRAGDGTRDPE